MVASLMIQSMERSIHLIKENVLAHPDMEFAKIFGLLHMFAKSILWMVQRKLY